tara:strand:- start:280 stop:1479 length:1200 start_codon:yes stop_codon:yes gene_type:complete
MKKLKSFHPYSCQNIDQSDINEVLNTLKSNFITQGPKIAEFEKNFAKYVGSKYAVACSNGTAALYIALKSLNFKKSQKIITSPITFLASANCSEFLGGNVIFADIDMSTYCISEVDLEKKLKKFKIKVLVLVHYAGNSSNLEKIKKIADKYNCKIIEDSCHALGGSYKKYKFGSCKYSEISTFSFHPVKPITTGEGGMITTNNSSIYEKLLLYRNHGMHKNIKSFKNKNLAYTSTKKVNQWYYEMENFSYNFRLTDIQSALGNSQLKKLDSFTKRRKKIAEIYDNQLKNNPNIIIPKPNLNVSHAYHLYTILIDYKKINTSRYDFMNNLRKYNIGTQVLYIPLYHQPYYKKKYNFKKKDFYNSEKFYSMCLSIPIFPSMKKQDVINISKIINYLTSNYE